MKQIFKIVAFFIATLVFIGAIMYLLFAFANYDLNVGNWDSFDRGFSCFVTVVISVFASLIFAFELIFKTK